MPTIKKVNCCRDKIPFNGIKKVITDTYSTAEAPSYIPITRIRMFSGDEDRWFEYVERMKLGNIQPNNMLFVTDIEGRRKLLNTQYIVSAEDNLTIVSVKVTKRSNGESLLYYWIVPDCDVAELKAIYNREEQTL